MKYLSVLIFSVLLFACNPKPEKSALGNTEENCESIVKVTKEEFTRIKTDEFDLKELAIRNNCLAVEIGFKGGCGTVNLDLTWDGIVVETQPQKVVLKPRFDDNDDCNKDMTNTSLFSLDLLNDYYEGETIIELSGYDKRVRYNFE